MKREYKVEGVEKSNPNNFGGMVSRSATITRAKADGGTGIPTIATTEAPALVIDWERWQVIREILPMKYAEMPNNDKTPLLDCHDASSTEDVLGSAKEWTISGTELNCNVYISSSEADLIVKVAEGHVDSVSIGYMTDPSYTVEVPKGAKVTVDGTEYSNDFEDGIPMIVRTWWKTKELSLVPIGADENAKFKANSENKRLMDKMEELKQEIDTLKGKQDTPATGKSKAIFERRLKMIESEINNY